MYLMAASVETGAYPGSVEHVALIVTWPLRRSAQPCAFTGDSRWKFKLSGRRRAGLVGPDETCRQCCPQLPPVSHPSPPRYLLCPQSSLLFRPCTGNLPKMSPHRAKVRVLPIKNPTSYAMPNSFSIKNIAIQINMDLLPNMTCSPHDLSQDTVIILYCYFCRDPSIVVTQQILSNLFFYDQSDNGDIPVSHNRG